MSEEVKAPGKPVNKKVSPGVQALRDVVENVYAEAREAKKRGEPVGWSSSKFPCELAEAFGLHASHWRISFDLEYLRNSSCYVDYCL